MKDWLAKFQAVKTWVLVLACCGAAMLYLALSPSAAAPAMTEEESRISQTLCRIAGAGETRVSIYYAQEASSFGSWAKTPVGAVIVALGAGDILVRLNLAQAAQTLLGLGPGQVEVFPMEEDK